uniref:Uncharacterized protein n=1 Tax=viral metagenome TaxID=1070528 RepID=A0A6C0EB47_9ZZZZ
MTNTCVCSKMMCDGTCLVLGDDDSPIRRQKRITRKRSFELFGKKAERHWREKKKKMKFPLFWNFFYLFKGE